MNAALPAVGPVAEQVARIDRGEISFALVKPGERPVTGEGRGVKPLLAHFRRAPEDFRRAELADKIVGRAAAAIAVLGGVSAVSAVVLSAGAAELLAAHGITARARTVVPVIVNRAGTGECPMECLTRALDTPEAIVAALTRKIFPETP